MRVLRTIHSDKEDWIPRLCTHRGQPYAILSHRWFEDANHEVLFADIQEIDQTIIDTLGNQHVGIVKNAQYAGGTARTKPGFMKVQAAARQALEDGHDYIWIDTCCIDKSSSAELAEAIVSMFKWYKASKICYAYLVDVADVTETLKALLSQRVNDWKAIGHKNLLGKAIADITGIEVGLFEQRWKIDRFSVAQRMSWASARTITRPEDMAYCLMSLFDVNMPVLYDEGEKAFVRLQEEIIKQSDDESIFAWRDKGLTEDSYSGMLATRPAAFARSQNFEFIYTYGLTATPYSMTNKGLSITLPLLSIKEEHNFYLALLRCTNDPVSAKSIGIYLKKMTCGGLQYARILSRNLGEGLPPVCDKIATIYVKQSWDRFSGFCGVHQMAMDMIDSSSPSPGD